MQNERYLELSAQLEDLKVSANAAKLRNETEAQKTLSQQIRKFIQGSTTLLAQPLNICTCLCIIELEHYDENDYFRNREYKEIA